MLKERLIDYDPATGRCESPPRQVFLEVSGRCNLACVHCSKDYGRPEAARERDLPLATVERLRPWLEGARFVNLNVVGESLLAPHFDAVVDLCVAGGAEVSFNTNGLPLSEERCERLVAQGVHSIAVSVDGWETNRAVRGVPYELVRDRLLRLTAAKERAGAERPHLALAWTLMRSNLRELPRVLEDLLPRARLHAVHVQPLVVFYPSLAGENVYDQSAVDEVVDRARALCAAHGVLLSLFRSRFVEDERHRFAAEQELGPWSEEYGCTDPFFEVKVRADGTLMACSFGREAPPTDYAGDLDAVWNSEWYRELRMALHAGRRPGRCAGCPTVHGCAAHQLTPLREVDHSRAAAFREALLPRA